MKRKEKRVRRAPSPAAKAEPAEARESRRGFWAAILALTVAVLAAFSNAFPSGFVLDNQTLLLEDSRIQNASASNLGLILGHTYWWPHGESGLYRPLTTLSYQLNYAILGNAAHPAGYHWINLLLHAVNVWLVFLLMRRLMAGRRRAAEIAFAAALLWAVHPVLTESVTNMVGRADLLAGLGVLSGFLFYLKSREAAGWRAGAWLAASAGAATVGSFSKEGAVVLPAVIVLYEAAVGREWRRMAVGCLSTALPIGAMLWQRSVVLASSMPAEYPFLDNPIAGAGLWTGRLTALEVLARYLWLAVWPVKLSADYSYAQIPLARGSAVDWLGWLAIAAAAVGMAILWKRDRLAFFFAGFAALNWLPASNLLFPIGTIMAERLLYLPLVGWVAAAVVGMEAAAARWRLPGRACAVVIAAIAIAFTVRTWVRNRDWTDDQTMARASVENSPDSFKVHRLLAAQLLGPDPAHGEIDRALGEADRSVAILAPLADDQDLPGPWNLAAVCHRLKGDALKGEQARVQYEQAARLAERAIAIDKASRAAYDRRHGIQSAVPANAAEPYRTLASADLHLDRAPEALAAATQAQAIDPANSGAYEEIADADLAQKRGEEAAVALAEGMFASGDSHLLSELLELYRGGLDGQGCAVKAGPHGPTLNPDCAIVHRDLCQATQRIHRPDLGRRMACENARGAP